MRQFDLELDVSEAAGLDEQAVIAVTVTLPDALADPPVVCFAKPGGGYAKEYYTLDLPGPGSGAQARWHAERGWVFVSVDHLGVGASSTRHDPLRLDYATLAGSAEAAEREVLRRLAAGDLAEGFPAVVEPVVLGIGQSMGACMTVVQQARHDSYHGIAVLGYSVVHTHPPARPGEPPIVAPWIPRDSLRSGPGPVLNKAQHARAARRAMEGNGMAMAWAFYFDDVDEELVRGDLVDFPTRNGILSAWASATVPGAVGRSCITPGVIAPEAAAVTVPVLVALGERDVSADPRGEPRAYLSADSVDLFVCPRMGHMHNFAGTRELLWTRIANWGSWVVQSVRCAA